MKIVVTGSIAFDYLMSFPGRFTEHILPDHLHRISLSFLVDTMQKRRGDCELAIVSPNDPAAMVQYAEECRTIGIPFIFDPGQQCTRMSGAELRDGLVGASILICNDYEIELLRQKTEMTEGDLLARVGAL